MPRREDLPAAEIEDIPTQWPVRRRKLLGDAHVFRFVTDTVQSPTAEELHRSYIDHPGAVVIIAVDERDRVVVVRQYRHPVGMKLLEAPAGLLDIDGEDPLSAAQRELAEEAQLAADRWHVLADCCPSPGNSGEAIRVFLARELRSAPVPEGFAAEGEEADMEVRWVAFDDLVRACRQGAIHNAALMVGVLTLAAARAAGQVEELRPADAPWLRGSAGAPNESLD